MDIADIRRARLRQWINEDPASLGNVEAWCHHYSQFVKEPDRPITATYIRQLVPKNGQPGRQIGERAARRLEKIGNKPAGWMDRMAGGDEAPADSPAESPTEKLEHVKQALAHMLAAAGLDADALIVERKNVGAYTPERIKEAVTEMVTRINAELPDLKASQVGEMVVLTLQTWIEERKQDDSERRDKNHGQEASQ